MFKTQKSNLLYLLFFLTFPAKAQISTPQSSNELLAQLKIANYDTLRVKTLQSLQQYYIQKRGFLKENLDSSLSYANQAILLADSLKRTDLKDQCLMLTGEAYLKFMNYDKGKSFYLQAANEYHASGKKSLEARALFIFAAKAMFYKSMPPELLDFAKRSLAIANQLGDNKGMMNGHLIVGILFDRFGNADSAGLHFQKAMPLAKLVGPEEVFKLHISLANFYRTQGDLVKALTNELAALQSLKDRKVSLKSKQYAFTNIEIARIYGSYDKRQSVKYLKDAMRYALINKNEGGMEQFYEALQNLVYMMNSFEDPTKTLKMAQGYIKKYPPLSDLEKGRVAGTLGICYKDLHQNELAEKYYLNAVDFLKNDVTLLPENKLALSRFYADIKQYKKSDSVLLSRPKKRMTTSFTEKASEEYVLYQIDSANHHYQSALEHFRRYKDLDDTLYNARKASQMYKLNAYYRSREKEQAIKLLKSESLSQRSELRQNRFVRNVTLGGLAVFLLISGTAIYGYLQKQRSNRLLLLQRSEIDRKNEKLESLNDTQRKLLSEKEWLLKEVHHRVKNNLQITMSLLSVQTQSTTSKIAKEALQNGQRRLHSMSLIHQKLYQSDSLAFVEMSSYITDLVAYLKDSFDHTDHIAFKIDSERLDLDVSQTVPLGLILNEAITNAIKHAFQGRKRGEIHVKLANECDDHYRLVISDNGIGMDHGSTTVKDSLGMELLAILAKQIDGELCINGKDGTTVSITFQVLDVAV